MDERSRAEGCLYGLAVGDALGMPTQLLARAEVVRRYGPRLRRFEPAPPDHPIAAGLPAGRVTDDTEQAMLLAEHLLAGDGHVEAERWARALAAWERDMAARGSLDLLGPSTRRAIAAVDAGVPVGESGREGTTNGAAMRIAPVGIATPSADNALLLDRVEEASRVTHNTGLALAGAAAVAAAVSAAVDGAELPDAIEAAVEAAHRAARRGRYVAGADVATRIEWAVNLVLDAGPQAGVEAVVELIGTSVATQESVPAAFAVLALSAGEPWPTCTLAASLGGDSDTIAAMAGAVAGALHGRNALPVAAVALVEERNRLGLDMLAGRLMDLRARSDGA